MRRHPSARRCHFGELMVDNYALQPCTKASRAPALALRRTGLSRRAGSRPESGAPQLMHLASNSNNELIETAEIIIGGASWRAKSGPNTVLSQRVRVSAGTPSSVADRERSDHRCPAKTERRPIAKKFRAQSRTD